MPVANLTPLDVAASIDRVLRRNIQFPDQTFTVGNYAVTVLMRTLLGDASGGVINFNLPSAVGLAGMRFTFKKTDSSANAVGVNAAGLETIDGAASVTLNQQNQAVSIESDGANWKVVSNFVQATPGSVTGMLDIAGIQKTDNDFSVLNPVPGTTIVFNTTRAGFSYFSVSAYTSGLSFGPYSGSIGVKVDGVDYTLFVDAQNNGAGGDFTSNMGYAGSIPVFLNPGVHTVSVIVTQSAIGFQATPNNPLTISVIFPTATGGVVAAATLVKQEVGPLTQNLPGPNPYTVPVGGTINVVLGVPQTVLVSAYGTLTDPGSNNCNGQIGIRVNGVDLDGTISSGGNDLNKNGLTITRAVNLPAGPNVVEFVHRTLGGAPSDLSDGYLTVVYNNPQEITPTPEAATLVVHPTAGEGDFQTIEAALAQLGVLGGGYVLVREGTYTPPAGGYIMPNVPAVVRGCGAKTLIDLGAVGDPIFVIGNSQIYTFEDFAVTGSAADVDRRLLSISAAANVRVNRVTGSNLRQVAEVTGGASPTLIFKTSTFVLLNNAGSWFVNGTATTTVHAESVSVTGAGSAGGISGSPVVNLYDTILSAVNGVTVGSNSVLDGCLLVGVAGETVTLGTRTKASDTRFSSVIVVAAGLKVCFNNCDFVGSAGQARVLDLTGVGGPNITGCTFSGCNSELIRMNAGVLDTEIVACDFIDDATASRAIDILGGSGRCSIVGNSFEFFATEAIQIAGFRCMVSGNTGCRVVETGGANLNRYSNNDGFDPTSTIIGGASLVENENVVQTSVDTLADEFMRTILVDASGANRTITLPTAASAKWRKYIIKKIDATANTVTIDADAAETIDGALTQVLAAQYDFIEIQSDGTQWWIV